MPMVRRFAKKGGLLLLTMSFIALSSSPYLYALQSANYRFDESAIGTNTLLESSSTNFQAIGSAGDISVGRASSSNYQVEAGSQTSGDPALSFSIDDSDADFGSFSATSASVTTTSFSVTNYTSYGYVIQIEGSPPTNGSHIIPGMTTTGPPVIGTEQFGINLVANTVPSSVGANPNNGGFGFGIAENNYDVVNEYRYVSGDIIASAPKSSGKTIYTISYLVNVDSLTPGGQYDSNQTIIVTGTY